ncbi:oxidoreductase [Lichenicoccus sp.]|uniref:oxidoreductase n=1 Tax=Lichenicoccus sp. TaxID=2781899 RepID=UPI003D0F8BAF
MKTWLITGISRGLGRALAEAALERGDTVIGTVREGAPAIETGRGALHLRSLEITDPAAVERVVAEAFSVTGRVDVLVNNAGYGLLGAIEDASDDEVERLFAVNLVGPFRLIRAALPRLRQQGSGHIVNITSIAGRAPMASSGLYAAAKSGMEGLSQSLAQEVAPLGIKVTAVAPGGFRTDFLSDHSIRRSGSAVARAYEATVGRALDHLDAMAGRQIGDPARAAQAIIAAVEADTPPLHLLLGSDALARTRVKLDAMREEMDCWESVTTGTDFPGETS